MRDKNFDVIRKAFAYSEKCKACSIENKADYEKIVHGPAYKDFTPRTVIGISEEKISSALELIVEEVWAYFDAKDIKDQMAYDEWHQEICENFLKELKNNGFGNVNYGKAQKILNMTMKYLFCFDDSQKKHAEKFKYCHMPLDRYTMKWFNKVVKPLAEKTGAKEKINESWSNFSFDEYILIQTHIRDYLKSSDNIAYINSEQESLTALEAEFYIWPEQQFLEAAEKFRKQALFVSDFPTVTDSQIITECKDLISIIQSKIQP